jgi:hypothetical protein
MKHEIGIIYIQRDKFQLYTPNLHSILEFRFLPEFIRDLDIVNKELLFNLLELFMKNNKIPPTSFIIVIADSASIIKDFPPSPQTTQTISPNIDEFLEHIPFEEVSSKKILLPNGIRAYATNKNLYETIKNFLIHTNSEVISILPATIIGPELHPSLDANGINTILKLYPTLKGYNLTTQPVQHLTIKENENHEEKKEENEVTFETPNTEVNEKKSDKKRTIILVAIFVFLIIVLIIVYLNSLQI